jgi:hypothetical protein
MKKIGLAIGALSIVLAIGLWGVGFWNAKSGHYWRHHAQEGALWAAMKLPVYKETIDWKAKLARYALRIHPVGVSNAEIEVAARLLQETRYPKEAAELLKVLVRREVAAFDYDSARKHAVLSYDLWSQESTLQDLIWLHRGDTEARGRWVAKLQASFPKNEIGLAYRCLSAYRSLASPPPVPCQRLTWVHNVAQDHHAEYTRLQQEITNYPQTSALAIQRLESETANYVGEIAGYDQQLVAIGKRADELGFDALGEFILEILPIPKANDTFESYAVREGLCSLPYVRVVCGLGAVVEVTERMDQRKAALEKKAAETMKLRLLTYDVMGYKTKDIANWRSGAYLESFQRSLNEEHGEFWLDLEGKVYAQIPEVGNDHHSVLAQLLP